MVPSYAHLDFWSSALLLVLTTNRRSQAQELACVPEALGRMVVRRFFRLEWCEQAHASSLKVAQRSRPLSLPPPATRFIEYS